MTSTGYLTRHLNLILLKVPSNSESIPQAQNKVKEASARAVAGEDRILEGFQNTLVRESRDRAGSLLQGPWRIAAAAALLLVAALLGRSMFQGGSEPGPRGLYLDDPEGILVTEPEPGFGTVMWAFANRDPLLTRVDVLVERAAQDGGWDLLVKSEDVAGTRFDLNPDQLAGLDSLRWQVTFLAPDGRPAIVATV